MHIIKRWCKCGDARTAVMYSRKRTMKRKILAIGLIFIVSMVLFALPISAAAINPTTINFYNPTYASKPNFEAFYNLSSSTIGDVLFVAEGYVYYAIPSNEPTADAGLSFNFEVLSPSGQVMLSTPLNDYGDRPISIYLTAAQVATLNSQFGISLINNNAIQFVIAGNPSYFGATTNGANQVMQIVTSNYWYNESLTQSLSYNLWSDYLQDFSIVMMTNIQKTDNPTTPYTYMSNGVRYINDSAGTSGQQSGSSILLQGVPNLQSFCPAVFKSSASPMTAGAPATTQSIQSGQSVQAMMGSTIARGVDGLRAYLGLQNNAGGRTLAGIIITVVACGFLVYYLTRKGFVDQRIIFIAVTLVIVSFGWLGVFPISVLFLLAAGVAIYTFYYFWTRGIL